MTILFANGGLDDVGRSHTGLGDKSRLSLCDSEPTPQFGPEASPLSAKATATPSRVVNSFFFHALAL